jgi:PPOX class probable F420-dependent enzyme
VDLDEAREFLRANHHAILATRRRDGSPQLSPVLVTIDDDGHAVISSRERAMKVRNLRRDPRLSICVIPDSFFGERFVQVDGEAQIVSQPDAMDGLVAYYRSIAGEHDDWDDYRQAMEREQRVLIRVAITRAGPDASG